MLSSQILPSVHLVEAPPDFIAAICATTAFIFGGRLVPRSVVNLTQGVRIDLTYARS
jgi:hypothetical protein